MKKYIELATKTRSATHLEIEVNYNKGGYNYFTHRDEKRGYYLHVSPVIYGERYGAMMVEYTAFSGLKYLLKEVSRKSAKAEAEAEKLAENVEKELIGIVCNKNGLEAPEA